MKLLRIALFFLATVFGCSSPPKLSEEQKAELTQLWLLYFKQDPSWPSKRDAALQDPTAKSFLIENLIREVILGADDSRSADPSFSPRSKRAQSELATIGPAAIPYLVAFFSAKDPAVAQLCIHVSSAIGEKAVPALRLVLQDPDPKLRMGALKALSGMDPAQAQEAVMETLQKDREWTVRGAAAKELLRYAGASSISALERALRDEDPFVRRCAAESLRTLGNRSSIPALIHYLQLATERADPKEMEASLDALRFLSKQKLSIDPRAWRAWWESEGKQ